MHILCMGETLLRFSTKQSQRFQKLDFDVHIGGCETNVCVNMAQYGFETSLLTKLPDHSIGDAVIQFLQSYNVDTSRIIRNDMRIGTYYLENGSGVRQSQVIYDRSFSAMTSMTLSDIHLDELFEDIDVFVVSGITLALSKGLKDTVIAMMDYARRHDIVIVYDNNYRSKLWSVEEASKAFRDVLPYVDILSAGELDAKVFLGIDSEKETFEERLSDIYSQIKKRYPHIQYMTCTKRIVHSASHNELTGYLYKDSLVSSETISIDHIVDRVGGGDAYLSGILYGLLNHKDIMYTVNFGACASALKHSVSGDVNQFKVSEIENFMTSGISQIHR